MGLLEAGLLGETGSGQEILGDAPNELKPEALVKISEVHVYLLSKIQSFWQDEQKAKYLQVAIFLEDSTVIGPSARQTWSAAIRS